MTEKNEKILKGAFLVAATALLFYFLFPKYYFLEGGRIRCNKITGSCERLIGSGEDSYWEGYGN